MGSRLTFLGRLHGAAGGRRGPQSFSAPADCGRRAEWKLGRDWKAGTWHPRDSGGSQREEERPRAAGRPGWALGAGLSPADTRWAGSAPRAPEKCHQGTCARGRPGFGPGPARSGAEMCAAPGARARPLGSGAATPPASSEPLSLALTQGCALPPPFLKLENTSPASLPARRSAPPPCSDITPLPARAGSGPGDSAPSAALSAPQGQLAARLGLGSSAVGRGTRDGAGARRMGRETEETWCDDTTAAGSRWERRSQRSLST
ncbi:atherin-like [Cavia porcellus]|uniref:atherin-like n=1 Tax=Cavia porcellus TaxID=10141 RepID=UPI002FDF1BC2